MKNMNIDDKFTKEQKELIEYAIKYMGFDYEADKEFIKFFRVPGKGLGIEFSPFDIKTKDVSILFYNDYNYSKIKYILDEAIQLKQLLQIKSEIETDLLKYKQLQAQSLIYIKSIEFENREMQPANKEYILKSVNETNPLVISQFELLLEQINRDIQNIESSKTKPVQATQSPNNGIVEYTYLFKGTDNRYSFVFEKTDLKIKDISNAIGYLMPKIGIGFKPIFSKKCYERILTNDLFNVSKELKDQIKNQLNTTVQISDEEPTNLLLFNELYSIINNSKSLLK